MLTFSAVFHATMTTPCTGETELTTVTAGRCPLFSSRPTTAVTARKHSAMGAVLNFTGRRTRERSPPLTAHMTRAAVTARLFPFSKVSTQERNAIGVTSVGRVSARAQTCRLTRGSTQGRSPIRALSAVRALTRPRIFMRICLSTRERNPTAVRAVGRASVGALT